MVAIPKRILVAGGGIVGNSVAYYLAQRQVPVTLVDPVGIAPAASAKAGGFLAKTWRDGTPLEQLQRVSFDLHQELANELSATKIDYRRLTCQAVAVEGSQVVQKPKARKAKDVEWVDIGVQGSAPMGNEDTIAQVHPKKLCNAMWEYAVEKAGSTLQIGRVVQVKLNSDGGIAGVELEDGTLVEGDALVIACGPWTQEVHDWFPRDADLGIPKITGVKCHSILVKSPDRVLNQAVFFESNHPDLQHGDLEVYPRPDGDAYVNGFSGDEVVMTERPGKEVVEDEDIELLKDAMWRTSTELGGLEPHTKQVCFWPETPDGLPLIGGIESVPGAFVAAGHSVWGILQGPATGKALSELILEGKASTVDLSPFGLNRYKASKK